MAYRKGLDPGRATAGFVPATLGLAGRGSLGAKLSGVTGADRGQKPKEKRIHPEQHLPRLIIFTPYAQAFYQRKQGIKRNGFAQVRGEAGV